MVWKSQVGTVCSVLPAVTPWLSGDGRATDGAVCPWALSTAADGQSCVRVRHDAASMSMVECHFLTGVTGRAVSQEWKGKQTIFREALFVSVCVCAWYLGVWSWAHTFATGASLEGEASTVIFLSKIAKHWPWFLLVWGYLSVIYLPLRVLWFSLPGSLFPDFPPRQLNSVRNILKLGIRKTTISSDSYSFKPWMYYSSFCVKGAIIAAPY